MIIRNMEVDVNILEELEPYMPQFYKSKITEDRIIACSPFRDEQKPSFAVNLINGTYIDSGNTTEWKQGNFVKLLSFFRGETYEDTSAYLLDKYRLILTDMSLLKLDYTLSVEKPKIILDEGILTQYMFRHSYLLARGIPENIQKGFKIGYDKPSKAVTFPVFNKKNELVNIKYRKVDNKIFWYHSEGDLIKQHLYGLNHIYRKNSKIAYIVEGEVDCLYLWANGYPSIATFGASLSKKQKKLILGSPLETLVIASDNDAVGRDFRNKLIKEFAGLINLKEIALPTNIKDVNELEELDLKEVCSNLYDIGITSYLPI